MSAGSEGSDRVSTASSIGYALLDAVSTIRRRRRGAGSLVVTSVRSTAATTKTLRSDVLQVQVGDPLRRARRLLHLGRRAAAHPPGRVLLRSVAAQLPDTSSRSDRAELVDVSCGGATTGERQRSRRSRRRPVPGRPSSTRSPRTPTWSPSASAATTLVRGLSPGRCVELPLGRPAAAHLPRRAWARAPRASTTVQPACPDRGTRRARRCTRCTAEDAGRPGAAGAATRSWCRRRAPAPSCRWRRATTPYRPGAWEAMDDDLRDGRGSHEGARSSSRAGAERGARHLRRRRGSGSTACRHGVARGRTGTRSPAARPRWPSWWSRTGR